nr:serine/threonine-protein kinase ppk16 [Quercus suber]
MASPTNLYPQEKTEQNSSHDEIAHPEKTSLGSPAASSGEKQDYDWTFTRIVAVAALCIVYVGSQVILYFVSAGLTVISRDLGTSIGNWMLTANTLSVAAVCPFVGYLTDLLGRRWICAFGTVCLIVSSIVMATTDSLGAAIGAMTIGGIGAGICELTAIAGVAEITPQRWRGVTLALVTFSIVPFMPQVLYFILISRSSWRWCFCLTGLWNFIGLVGLLLCYRPPPRNMVDTLSRADILKRIDYVGALLSIGGVTLFLVGLQAGGYQYPWTSGTTLGPLIVGGLMLFAFAAWEAWGPHKYPMVPGSIFKGQRVVALAFGIVFIAGMDFYSILGFFPIQLQSVYRTSDILYGVRCLCYPWAILGGACIDTIAAFTGALAASTPNNATFTVTMATFAALGNGALVVPALTLALYACPDEYIGTTSALSLTARFLGGSIGTSIYFNVFNTQITANAASVASAAIQAGLPAANAESFVGALLGGDTAAATAVPGVTDAVIQAATLATQWAYADALKFVWYTTIPFGVISCVCCLFLPNIRKYMTNRVAVPEEARPGRQRFGSEDPVLMPPVRSQAEYELQAQRSKLANSYQSLLNEFASPDLQSVGNYTLGRLIGKGSFGKVYLGSHKLTNGSKVVLKSAKKEDANLAREIHHHRQFLHPHIARLYEVIVTESLVWLVLEYCPGDELYNYLLAHGRMEPAQVQKVFTQLVGAVSYVHAKSCVHRDLKLENILLDKHGNVKLVDFGFTREYQGSTSYLQTWCGTVCYSAPEMLRGEKYAGEKVDVWSLGIILYALLCGELPFDEDDDNATKALILKDVPNFPDHVPEQARELIMKLLSKRPILRPTLSDILKEPWLAEHAPQQQEILKLQQPPAFSTQVEKDTLQRMRSAGVDIDEVIENVLSQRCDSLAGWWALLIEKEQRKERRKERKRRERDSDAKSIRRLSAASTRLLAQSALVGIYEGEEHGVHRSPSARGRRTHHANGNALHVPDLPKVREVKSPTPEIESPPELPKAPEQREAARSTSRPPLPPKDPVASQRPQRPRNPSRGSGSMLRYSTINPDLLSPQYVPPPQRKRRTFNPMPIKDQLAWVKHWFKEGTKRAKSPMDGLGKGGVSTHPMNGPSARTNDSQQAIGRDLRRVSTGPGAQAVRRTSVHSRPDLQTRATMPVRPRINTSSSVGSTASARGKRTSLSPATLTPHSSYRRSSGLRGRKSTSSSVSSIRSTFKPAHHHTHSKASSTSSASVVSPSGLSSASGSRPGRSPHASVKVLPSTPTTGSFPSGIRISRRAPPGTLTLPVLTGDAKAGFGAGAGGLASPGLPVFARRKRSVFKGPMGGSPSGHGRTSYTSGAGRPVSMSGRRSGEGAAITGIEEEEEDEFEEVEEVDQFGPELDPMAPSEGLVEEREDDDRGTAARASDLGSPLSPLATPLDEGPELGASPRDDGVGAGGGVPLTAEALKKMEEQEDSKLVDHDVSAHVLPAGNP